MNLEREDWLVADARLRARAAKWWIPAAAGLAGEALLIASLVLWIRQGGTLGATLGCGLLAARVICGSIGCYCWFVCDRVPEFWGFRAKWVMQFMPGAALAWRRRLWIEAFVERLAGADAELRIELATEQRAYYKKGSETSELGRHRREMAGWAAAAKECQARWEAEREAEKMKSAKERERVLEEMGLGRHQIARSMRSLERLEISQESSPASEKGSPVRL